MKKDIIEELFTKYYNDAMLYTLSLTKNRMLAEEIVANSYFKAIKSIDYKINNFKPWLIKVCRNEYLLHLRKDKKLTELDDKLRGEGQEIVDKIIKNEEYRALYHAISLLNTSQKEVLTLFYFEDMSIQDIASITGKNQNVVKVTLFRARENLKKILKQTI